MGKILCPCGDIIRTSGYIPNPQQYSFASDEDLDEYTGVLDFDELYVEMKLFYKCNTCSRLYVFWNNKVNKFVRYRIEPDDELPPD